MIRMLCYGLWALSAAGWLGWVILHEVVRQTLG